MDMETEQTMPLIQGGERETTSLTSATTTAESAGGKRTWILLGVLGVALAAVYGGVINEWVRDWIRDSNYNHGFLIPPIVAYLIWTKRKALAEAKRSPSILGLIGMLGSAALLVLGTAGAEVFTQRVSFSLFLPSAILFLFGWRHFRLTLFPFSLLLLAIPLPYVIYYGLTAPMQAFAAKCAIFGLHLVGVPVAAEGNIIHLSNTSLEVAEACSGIRSLYAFLTLGALVAYSTPAPGWARALIFLFTIPLSVAGNAVRVFGTGIAVHLFGPSMAEGTVHEMFGMIVIAFSLGVFLIIKSIARRLWLSASSSP